MNLYCSKNELLTTGCAVSFVLCEGTHKVKSSLNSACAMSYFCFGVGGSDWKH